MISAEVRTLSAKVSGRDIAFVFGGAIGDMIVLSDILDDFIEAQREVNRRFLLVCKPNEAAFLREIKPDIASYVAPFDLNAYLKSSRYRKKRRELIKELSHFALISPRKANMQKG